MTASINRVTLFGNLGESPEIGTMPSGHTVANLIVATHAEWRGREGQQNRETSFHRVVVMIDGVVNLLRKHAQKGDSVLIEGELASRCLTDLDGTQRWTCEIVVRPFRGRCILASKTNLQA